LVTIATLLCSALVISAVAMRRFGDIDDDGDVDLYDVSLACSQYKLSAEDPNYNATIVERADLAPPYGVIDIFDIVTIVSAYTGSK